MRNIFKIAGTISKFYVWEYETVELTTREDYDSYRRFGWPRGIGG